MWRDWDEEVVKEDFRRLAEGGLTVLRIFRSGRIFSQFNACGARMALR